MSENDPERLADAREREAAELQQQSDRLAEDVSDARDDWERKRADEGVPGAPPHEKSPAADEGDAADSPDPNAPPPGAGPSEAEMPEEGAGGPPADVIDENRDED
jgi:hypothetical protein